MSYVWHFLTRKSSNLQIKCSSKMETTSSTSNPAEKDSVDSLSGMPPGLSAGSRFTTSMNISCSQHTMNTILNIPYIHCLQKKSRTFSIVT